MPGQRSPNVVQVNLRLTKELRNLLQRLAKTNGRSFNAEVVDRIQQTFRRTLADDILKKAEETEKWAQEELLEAKIIYSTIAARIDRPKGAAAPLAKQTKPRRLQRKKK